MPKILLVEDDKESAKSLSSLLQKKGYSVVSVFKGEDAFRLLQDEKFDLAIIDLILPDMQGHSLCALIRHDKKIKNLPIIVSTGLNDSFTKETSQDIGANEFLGKPYHRDDLISAVERCLSGKANKKP